MISQKNILKMGLRQEIYNYIRNNPGVHQRDLSKISNIPKSTLIHHLRYLEKQELIVTTNHMGYKRYFLSNKFGQMEKLLLNLLREETSRNILFMFLYQCNLSQIELSEALEKTPATILFHMKKLVRYNIIEPMHIKGKFLQTIMPNQVIDRIPINNEIVYHIKNKEIIFTLYDLIITHGDSLVDHEFFEGFVEGLRDDLSYKSGRFKVAMGPKKRYHEAEKVFWEIFPHPYHV